MNIYETTVNEKLGIDNRTIELKELGIKLREETEEVIKELDKLGEKESDKTRILALGEILDVIQVILILRTRLVNGDEDRFKAAVAKHNYKLWIDRKWERGQGYNIEVIKGVEKWDQRNI